MKNGAELLDRLIKDIVSESAASYVSVLESPVDFDSDQKGDPVTHLPTAFSLPRFIPLLKERIWVVNPFTRNFLVGWITLLDSIPDLELVTYLPDFLGGLLKFLSDQNSDVRASTQTCLDKFLNEIKRISNLKKNIIDNKKLRDGGKRKRQDSVDSESVRPVMDEGEEIDSDVLEDEHDMVEEDWIPGQDVEINYKEVLEILTATLDSPLGMFLTPSQGFKRLTQSVCIIRRGLSPGISSVDCRIPRHLPRRGSPIHPKNPGSYASGNGEQQGDYQTSSYQSQ